MVSLKPSNLDFNQSATIPVGGMTALFLLEKAKISAGNKVLIYGASGSVGTYAIQLAKYFGATVTGVSSTANIELVKDLGADKVIDYRKEDYTNQDDEFDIIFDAVGKTSKKEANKILQKNGVFVSVNMMTKESNGHLLKLKELAEQGQLRPHIDKTYKLEETVAAHQHVVTGRKRGNVVIEII